MCDEFANEVLKIAVAQIVRAFGYGAAEQTALDTLTDVVRAYIEEVGQNSRELAELACRTEPNFHDVCIALKEMRTKPIDLIRYRNKFDEMTFARSVPAFPLATKKESTPVLRDRAAPRPSHIPEFLPPFPDTHSYIKTPVYVQRDYDPRIIREQVNQQRLVAENNLARLHKQTLGSEFDVVNYEHATKQRNPVPEIAPGFVHPQAEKMEVESEPPRPQTPPATPLTKDSQYVTRLYEVPAEKEETSAAPAAPTPQEEELRKKVDKILELKHRDNMIESVDGPPLRYHITHYDGT